MKFEQYNPEEALQTLIEGNRKFVADEGTTGRHLSQKRKELILEQHPIACILGCADARVPPQLIFDRKLGDLFIIRVAGNVLDDVVLASLEYGVFVLNTPLVVVMGHYGCGAVDATLNGHNFTSHIRTLTNLVEPAVEWAKTQEGDTLDLAVRKNILNQTEKLHSTEQIFKSKIDSGQLLIKSAYYDLATGKVDFID
ncbi:MAG: carbonic anhydrase [SAR324 cluster bacterium]|nr:carbonic anhydrase [SAR324 cluster bacterium]